MLTLHYLAGAASLAPHIVLNELGVPFQLQRVNRDAGEHKLPPYLALNPNGLIPVMVDDDLVLYESTAIVLHLVDTHPAAGLAPALGTPQRAHFYKWLVWLTNTLQATLIHYFYPERMVDTGNSAGAAQIKAHAQARAQVCLAQIDDYLAAHGGAWLLGDDYSAADACAFMLCRWTRGFSDQPARDFPHIAAYLQRMLARDAVQRAFNAEGLQPPWV